MGKSTERIASFDIMKGIGILLVIIGHSGLVDSVEINSTGISCFSLIYAFHMPLFFVISGYFFHLQPFFVAMRKDFIRLLLPYVSTSLVIIGAFCIVKSFSFDFSYVPRFSIGFICGYGPVVWFLFAMFIARTLYNLVGYYLEPKLGVLASSFIIIIISMIGFLLQEQMTVYLYQEPVVIFSLLPAFAALSFIHIGRLWYYSCQKRCDWKVLIVLLCLFYFVSSYYGGISMYSGRYPNILINIGGAIGGTLIVCAISKQIERINLISVFFQWVGKSSLLILCVHCIDFVLGSRVRISSPATSCFCMVFLALFISYCLSKTSVIRKVFCL